MVLRLILYLIVIVILCVAIFLALFCVASMVALMSGITYERAKKDAIAYGVSSLAVFIVLCVMYRVDCSMAADNLSVNIINRYLAILLGTVFLGVLVAKARIHKRLKQKQEQQDRELTEKDLFSKQMSGMVSGYTLSAINMAILNYSICAEDITYLQSLIVECPENAWYGLETAKDTKSQIPTFFAACIVDVLGHYNEVLHFFDDEQNHCEGIPFQTKEKDINEYRRSGDLYYNIQNHFYNKEIVLCLLATKEISIRAFIECLCMREHVFLANYAAKCVSDEIMWQRGLSVTGTLDEAYQVVNKKYAKRLTMGLVKNLGFLNKQYGDRVVDNGLFPEGEAYEYSKYGKERPLSESVL